ncbi:PucR family transcriptional regulator [Streptomyces sp. NPDC017940]|uniref:PucR family transcriptional regulator n=1 Tax=Streptomyces sp. NPDC017940 TaxID=3365017 RepID=UPI00379A37AE
MGSLFAELARRAPASARREVETYAQEIPEFGVLEADPRARSETLEYAVWLRRRTIEMSPSQLALTQSDLDHIASMGESRGRTGMSLESRQRVLGLHTALMLRELNEAADALRGSGVDELIRMMSWFAAQGERGVGAYCRGFVTGLRHRLPYVEQVALLTGTLLTGDPMAGELASAVGLPWEAEHWAVTVVRVPDWRPATNGRDRELDGELESLVKAYQVPLVWRCAETPEGGGGELIALTPCPPPIAASVPLPPPQSAGDLVRDFAGALGLPCAAGTATASGPELAAALDRARRVSRAAPLHRAPRRLGTHTVADVFVELAVADAPFVDDWLRALAHRLAPGPDLLVTLDAYYHHDMNRTATATALNVHPRTLDYRLRRVRELTGIAPASTRGVRVLSAVVTRSLSGGWC